MTSSLCRRKFLQTAAAAAAAAVSAGGAQAQDKPSFDETFDIIVP